MATIISNFNLVSVGPPTVITAAGNLVLTGQSNWMQIINKTVGAATQVTLPPIVVGSVQEIVIKDGKGDAATNNITIVAGSGLLIDGQSQYVLNVSYGAIQLTSWGDGVNWAIT